MLATCAASAQARVTRIVIDTQVSPAFNGASFGSAGPYETLAGRAFVCGPDYSIADITTLVTVDFAKWIKLAIPEDSVHLRRWYDEVSARPSAKA